MVLSTRRFLLLCVLRGGAFANQQEHTFTPPTQQTIPTSANTTSTGGVMPVTAVTNHFDHHLRSRACLADIEAAQWRTRWLPSHVPGHNLGRQHSQEVFRCCHASCAHKEPKGTHKT